MSTRTRLAVVAALALAIALVVALRRDHAASVPPPSEAQATAVAPSGQAATPSEPAQEADDEALSAAAAGSSSDRGIAASAAPSPVPGPLPRLVDVGADKCIPCKAMAPILEELRLEYAGRLRVDFIDAWKYPAQAAPFDVYGIPTQIFFNPAGRELQRHLGFISKEEILDTWRRLGFPLTPGKKS